VAKAKPVAKKARDEASAASIHLIGKDDFETINAMADSLQRCSTAMNILEHPQARFEESLFWDDFEHNVPCKVRIDCTRPDIRLLADLKTAASAAPSEFARACANYNYDIQAAHYLEGAYTVLGQTFDHFCFIVVEKTPPYAVAVYRAHNQMLANGHERAKKAKQIYAECNETGSWPAYPDTVQDINLPGWALNKED